MTRPVRIKEMSLCQQKESLYVKGFEPMTNSLYSIHLACPGARDMPKISARANAPDIKSACIYCRRLERQACSQMPQQCKCTYVKPFIMESS